MPNHIHLIAVPQTKQGMNLAIGEAHRRYTRRINFHEGWWGHLWQGRFALFVMDEKYLLACTRYIELNPVRAGLAERAEDWPWSSTQAQIKGKNIILVNTIPLLAMVNKPWEKFLSSDVKKSEIEMFRKHELIGRPLGGSPFIEQLEVILERRLKLKKPRSIEKISKVSPDLHCKMANKIYMLFLLR